MRGLVHVRGSRSGRRRGVRLFGVVAAVLWISACDSADQPESKWRVVESLAADPTCAPGEEQGSIESVMVLRERETFCEILALRVASLQPSFDGDYPDVGNRIVRRADGSYLTTATGGQVLFWDAAGEFQRGFGRWGEGPGEFVQQGAVLLFLGPQDTLYVLDGAQRWTVFDPQLNFHRTFRGTASGRNRGSMVVTERGIVTTGRLVEGHGERAFQTMSFDGEPALDFGPPLPVRTGGMPAVAEDRESAYDPARGTLWVAPAAGWSGRVILEEWDLEGRHLRSLERHAPWLPRNGYSPSQDPTEPILPQVRSLSVDPDGIVWAVIWVRSAEWRVVDAEARRELADELYEFRLEAIDPATGMVLASWTNDLPRDSPPPFERFIPVNGSRGAYRITQDSLGLRTAEIFDLYLDDGR
jgi:hypothetical protein